MRTKTPLDFFLITLKMAFCRTLASNLTNTYKIPNLHEYGWVSKLEGSSKSYFQPKVRKNTKGFSKFLGSRRPEIISKWIKRVACSCCVVAYQRDRVMQDSSSEAAKSAATNALRSANNSLIAT